MVKEIKFIENLYTFDIRSDKLKLHSISFNMILNLIRTIFTSIFPLISFKYVSTILGQESFGKINYSASIVQYFSIAAALGISTYAIRECAKVRDEKEKCNNLVNQLFTLNICSMTIVYILMFLLLFCIPSLKNYRMLILIQSLSIFFTTIGVDWVNQVFEDFLFITIRTVFAQVLSLFLVIIFVHSQEDYISYAIITTMSTVIISVLNRIYVRKYVKVKLQFDYKILQHLRPVFLIFFMNLSISIYVSSDITLIGIFGTDAMVGIYTVGSKVYSCMKTLVAAVITVIIPRLSYYFGREDKKYISNLEFVFTVVLFLIMPIFVGIEMIPEFLINLISDSTYGSAIDIVRILGIALIPTMLSTIINNGILLIQGKEKKILINTVISGLANLLLNAIFINLYGFVAAAYTTLFSEILVLCICLIQVRNTLKKMNMVNIIKNILKNFVGIIYIFFMYFVIGMFFDRTVLFYIIYVIICIIGYFVIGVLMKNEVIMHFLKIINK